MCPSGYYCSSAGLTAPSGPCLAGFYCLSGASSPSPLGKLGVFICLCPISRGFGNFKKNVWLGPFVSIVSPFIGHFFCFLCPRYVGERRPLSCEPLLPRRNQLALTLPCRDLQQSHKTSCVLPLCCRLLLPRKYHQLQYKSLPSWLLLPQR